VPSRGLQRGSATLLAVGALVLLPPERLTVRTRVPSYRELPDDVRREVLLGSPRSSTQIEDSPFATHTTICAEGGDDDYVQQAAGLISQAGYKWIVDYVRVDSSSATQRNEPDGPALARCEKYLKEARGLNLSVLLRLDVLPSEALRQKTLDASQRQAAATSARNVVRRLKPLVSHWQVGNEPNVDGTPEAYVQLASAVSRAIRTEQPNALVYGPASAMLQCLSDHPLPWLDRALAAGLLEHIDVFSYHPYRANGDLPEQASEFERFRKWPSYHTQLAELRQRLRAKNGGKDVRLSTSEDGEGSGVSATGEQRVTWVIDAKNELRRALLDFWNGVYPRTHFAFFRNIPEAFYSTEGSFNALTRGLEKKPIYHAAQNLHAVLDRSYRRDETVHVKLERLRGGLSELGRLGPYVQTYTKSHPAFDELLVFFWSTHAAENLHRRIPVSVSIESPDWEAPVVIDLMTMPGQAMTVGHMPSKHQRWRAVEAHRTAHGVQVEPLEMRDYPMLLKLVRRH